MGNCNDKNPLQRSGTSRDQRLLPALQKGYANVDEREYADWIVFAAEFARYLHYIDNNGEQRGDWTPFFSSDVSAILGSIAIQDIDAYRRGIKERFDFLKDNNNSVDLPGVERKLNDLFSALFTLSKALDENLLKLPKEVMLKATMQNLIKTKLAPALLRLIRYYKGAGDLNFLLPVTLTGHKILNKEVVDATLITEGEGLSQYWWVNAASNWKDYYDPIVKDISIFGDAAWDEFKRINHAANHNLLTTIFDQYLMVYSKIVQEAEKELLKTLEDWNTHPAHYTLFLAFLKLFRFAQADINTVTQRHLDYYYKEVLRLTPKPALPNHAHILAELAKPINDVMLPEATLFKAGKDSESKEVVYGLDKTETFNKAKVAWLKSVYLGIEEDNYPKPVPVVINSGRLFAAPVANSADGIGAELTSAFKEWHPFVNRSYEETELVDIITPNAQIGFAIASHYLFLTEGIRKIYIRLGSDNNAALVNQLFDCYLTTEKEWYAVPPAYISPITLSAMSDTSSCAELLITLPGDAPAITDYNAEIHGGTLQANTPVVKVFLKNDDASSYQYELLRSIAIDKTEIKVEVGVVGSFSQTGMKQLLLSNDSGPLDAAKPFIPFGAQPQKDATFVVGNRELFVKKNASVSLNIEWGNLPAATVDIKYDTTYLSFINSATSRYTYSAIRSATPYYPDVKVQFLADGIWSNLNDDSSAIPSANILNGISSTVVVFASGGQMVASKSIFSYEEDYEPLSVSSTSGYLRLVLNGDFGHKKYWSDLTSFLVDKNISDYYPKEVGVQPIEPYTPTIQSLFLSYTAYSGVENLNSLSESEFTDRALQYYHLYPFGDAEQHSYLNRVTKLYLLPQFTHKDPEGIRHNHQGEFYIGLESLPPNQSVNILFQVLDGSANPLLDKPDEHITWSYLSNNDWIPFLPQHVSDATQQLIQSGIISFIIPADATTNNTMQAAGYLWLRASIDQDADAVCKLLSVDAQAALVTFNDNDNAADFLNTALPAGTISKLKIPLSAIKKITQPYSSFGGRTVESSEDFHVRVSERLRHKARAITIWDYEHLVLEEFPGIHKVKCLNHTKFEGTEYNEVQPGHVTIITLPDLVNRNDVNPLQPYTSQDMLVDISEFLKKKISCHVKLHVRNPQFEEVKLEFTLQLIKGYDDFTFYSNQLKQEITQFLTPWAFTDGIDIQFGGKIYKSVIINFIEERPYVDFITDVSMYHRLGENEPFSNNLDESVATTAKSILVSVPASQHIIHPSDELKLTEQAECDYVKKNQSKTKGR